jgi:hypothetical protein
MKKQLVTGSLIIVSLAFSTLNNHLKDKEPEYIPASTQRSGNAAQGYNYLTTGNYLKSGIPYQVFMLGTAKDSNNFLQRTGFNKNLSYDFTAVQAPNGELVVAPNCLQCHAQVFEGKLVIGLGNSFSDFTQNRAGIAVMLKNY